MKPPVAKRYVLILLAGSIWSAVGLILMVVAGQWLQPFGSEAALSIGIGLVAGVAVSRFMFAKLAQQNIDRIYSQAPGKDKVCLFAFQNTRSYFIVVIMMVMGYTLRHSPIPKDYLAPGYLAIGLGLFLSSLRYYRRIGG